MPPRFAYWTIILDGKPTAFRTRTSEELVPTLRQLQARHPEAVMRWFARGRLWASPEEERAAAARKLERQRRRPDWRPGGEHRDPRERFKLSRDEKRRRFAAKQRRDGDEAARAEPPRDNAGSSYVRRRPASRPPGPSGRGPRGGWNRGRGRSRGNGGGGRGGRGGK